MISGRCPMGELVSAALDAEATDLEQAAVRRHLRSCATCREFQAFSRGVRVRAGEGLALSTGLSRADGMPAGISGSRLAAEVRRDRGRRTVRNVTAMLMAVLAFGVILGLGGARVLGERGRSGSVPAAYETRLMPSRPLDRYSDRLAEAPAREPVMQSVAMSPAEWDAAFVGQGLSRAAERARTTRVW